MDEYIRIIDNTGIEHSGMVTAYQHKKSITVFINDFYQGHMNLTLNWNKTIKKYKSALLDDKRQYFIEPVDVPEEGFIGPHKHKNRPADIKIIPGK
jgi:Tfp pilus tip-associated adhesin PilY1